MKKCQTSLTLLFTLCTTVVLAQDSLEVKDSADNLLMKVKDAGTTGTVQTTGNLELPGTTATIGIIFSGGDRYIHHFGNNNFFAGVRAGNLSMTGDRNTVVGEDALTANTGGDENTAVGNDAMLANTTGDRNTAVGKNALTANISGNRNTAVGRFALDTNTTGNSNTALGYNADVNASGLTNATAIGAGAVVDASNKVRIGNASVSVIEGQVDWTFSSDVRKKENFLSADGEAVLQKLRDFKLTSWNYKGHDPATQRHYGPMAQDFFAAFGYDGMGTVGNDTTLTGSDVSGVNMIAIQALEKRTQQQQETIAVLQAENEVLRKRVAELSGLQTKVTQIEIALQRLGGKASIKLTSIK